MGQLPVAGDADQPSGHQAFVHVPGEVPVDTRKTFGIESQR